MKFQNKPQKDESGRIVPLPVEKIRPNPNQPRRTFETEPLLRLAESIREYGMLQPISVRRTSPEEETLCASPAVSVVCDPSLPEAEFEIIAGERRFRAAKILGMREVPCLILDVSCARSAELSLIENIQRENLNPFEQASAIASLIDLYGLTQEQIARKISSSQSFVANKLRLLRLTLPERSLILDAGLTERHARAVLTLPTAEERLRVLRQAAEKNLNVSQTEALAARRPKPRTKHPSPRLFCRDLRIVYNTLDRAIGSISSAGIPVEKEQRDAGQFVEILLRIPKQGREGEIVSRETSEAQEDNVSRETSEQPAGQ